MSMSNKETVRHHGALGNGIKDDTKALQRAIDYGARTGWIVLIPSGRYKVTGPLLIKSSNVKIVGENAEIFSDIAPVLFSFSEDVENVEISNLKLTTTAFTGGLDDFGVICSLHKELKNITLDSLEISVPNIDVNGVKIVCEPVGKKIEHFTIKNSKFINNGRMGIEFQNHATDYLPRLYDIKVHDCQFINMGTANLEGIGMGVSVSGVGKGVLIQKNYFADTVYSAIEVVNMNDIIVENNIGSIFTKDTAGICITADEDPMIYMSNVYVRGNIFTGITSSNYFYNIVSGVIESNTFEITGPLLWSTIDYRATILRLKDTIVSKNRFISNLGYGALTVDTGENCLIAENYFDSSVSPDNYATLSLGTATCVKNIVKNNRFKENPNFGVNIESGGVLNWYEKNFNDSNKDINEATQQTITEDLELLDLFASSNFIEFIGTPSSGVTVTMPTFVKEWTIKNSTNKTVTIKYATGASVSIVAGTTVLLEGNGIDIVKIM